MHDPPHRFFAALNTALADTLLAATYWNESYRNGRVERPIDPLSPLDVVRLPADDVRVTPHSGGRWWVAKRLSGFPAIPATLAGAAEAILRSNFSGEAAFALPGNASNPGAQTEFVSLRFAARQCAWAALGDGASPPESCVAGYPGFADSSAKSGYDLGSRIAGHFLKQNRR